MTTVSRSRPGAWLADGGWVLGAYLAVAVIGLASIRLFTELASPAVFGEANLLLSLLILALTTVSTPFTNTQLRFHSAAVAAGRGDGFTRQVLAHVLGAGGAVCAIAALAWAGLAAMGQTRLGGLGAAGALLLGLLTLVRGVLYGRVQADRRNRAYASLLVAEALAVAVCTGLALRAAPTVDGYVLGQASGMALAALLGLLVAPGLRGSAEFGAPSFARRAWRYGAPFAPMSLLSWLANMVDRYVLAVLAGPAAAGRYVAPFSIASRGVSLIGGALNDLYRPALFEAVNAGQVQQARKVFRHWMWVRSATAVACVLGLWALGPWLSTLLLAPAYRQDAPAVMVWVAIAYGAQGVIQVAETRLMSLDRTRRLLFPLITGGLANLAFSLVLIPREGAVGAAQATTASFLVQGLVTAALLHGALKRAS
jgi:O-antigen/teichoic acid export membrane protein